MVSGTVFVRTAFVIQAAAPRMLATETKVIIIWLGTPAIATRKCETAMAWGTIGRAVLAGGVGW